MWLISEIETGAGVQGTRKESRCGPPPRWRTPRWRSRSLQAKRRQLQHVSRAHAAGSLRPRRLSRAAHALQPRIRTAPDGARRDSVVPRCQPRARVERCNCLRATWPASAVLANTRPFTGWTGHSSSTTSTSHHHHRHFIPAPNPCLSRTLALPSSLYSPSILQLLTHCAPRSRPFLSTSSLRALHPPASVPSFRPRACRVRLVVRQTRPPPSARVTSPGSENPSHSQSPACALFAVAHPPSRPPARAKLLPPYQPREPICPDVFPTTRQYRQAVFPNPPPAHSLLRRGN